MLFVLVSCTYEGIAPIKNAPVREIYYDFEAGEKTGEKTFSYDANGNLIRESFTDLNSPLSNFDVFYEYDGNGNLIKERQTYPGLALIKEYAWSGKRIVTETTRREGANPLGHVEYFYSANDMPDSVRRWTYSTTDGKFLYANTSIYLYSENKLLKTEIVTSHRHIASSRVEYTYDGQNLVSTCDVIPGYNGGEFLNCTVQEYDRNGQLTKILLQTSDGFSELKEEFFYESGMLYEKRIYTYRTYDPSDNLYVTQIKFEY